MTGTVIGFRWCFSQLFSLSRRAVCRKADRLLMPKNVALIELEGHALWADIRNSLLKGGSHFKARQRNDARSKTTSRPYT